MDAEHIKKSISESGVFFTEDAEIGRRVDEFATKKYPIQTEEGLALLQTILGDKRVRGTVESHFEHSGLGMFKVFGPHKDTARALLNRTTDRLLALAVLLCCSGSQIILYEGSHKHELDAIPGGTGLLELPRASMKRPGITETEVVMENGGLVIYDARFFGTIWEGSVIELAFAEEEELREWGKMLLPKSLERIVAGMKDEKIRMNFKFVAAKISDE